MPGFPQAVAESQAGHLASISLGRQGALWGGPCGWLGAGMLGQAVCVG
jgi:hypothetical protein